MGLLSRFGRELKRRQVFGTAALYAVAAWAVIEVGDMAIGAGMISGITTHNLFTLALVGFPLVLVAGWFYDVTKKGIFRTGPADAGADFKRSLRGRDFLVFLVMLGAWAGSYLYLHTPPAVERSIAIMPFENRGNDPENAHFAFGIRDDLMTQLQRVGDLTLIAGAAASQLDSNLPVEQIGLRLGAAFIMKGTVERVLDRIRVNVVLLEAADARQAWAGSFDRELSALNLFDIRDQITSEITGNLQAVLSPEEKVRVFDLPTMNLEANSHYMRGRQLMATRGVEELLRAVEEFKRAVEIDPQFALAWVGLADATTLSHSSLYTKPGGMSREEAWSIHDKAVQTALSLNDQLGEAWASRGDYLRVHGKPREAEEAYLKAIALAPSYARAYHMYQFSMAKTEQLQRRLELIYKAVQLDPMSVVYKSNLSSLLSRLGRSDEAIQQGLQTVEMHPDSAVSYRSLGTIYSTEGQHADAAMMKQKAVEMDPNNRVYLRELALAYLELQEFDAARGVMDLIRERLGPDRPGSFWGLATEVDILMRQERFAEVLAIFDALPEWAAGFGGFTKYRGDIRLFQGDYAGARDDWLEISDEWFLPGDSRTMVIPDGMPCINAGILFALGEEDQAQAVLDGEKRHHEEVLARNVGHLHRWNDLGVCALVQGDMDEALAFFDERAGHGHFQDWWYIRLLPWWEPVRNDPRFIALDEKVEALLAGQRAILERDHHQQ